jgi:tetratricopeptide (TPR) repeat protein
MIRWDFRATRLWRVWLDLVRGAQVAVLVSVVTMPAVVRADALDDAKTHFKKGSEFYKQARYPDAITEFQAAYQAKPAGELFYNIAQCYEKLNDIPNALRGYRDYLREKPLADDRDRIEVVVGNLEQRLALQNQQALLVYSDPSPAQVAVDGKSLGPTPFSAALTPGEHKVEVTKSGFQTAQREVTLTKEHSLQLVLTLTQASALAAKQNPATSELGSKQTGSETPSKPRFWTWVAAGASGAALVSGALVGLAAQSNSNKLRGTQINDGKTNQQLYDSAKSEAQAANILYVVAGVAGATGVTLFFVEGRF